MRRREFLAAAATAAAMQAQDANAIVVEPQPLFEISPLLYMQFMEPLGTTALSKPRGIMSGATGAAISAPSRAIWRREPFASAGCSAATTDGARASGLCAASDDAQLRLGRQRDESRGHA